MINIVALLKTFIYLIASSLLYPVLFLLVLLTVLILIYSGSFFAEFLERIRLQKYASEQLPAMIRENRESGIFSHRTREYLRRLRQLLNESPVSELAIENLLQEYTLHIWKAMDRLRIIVRVGPALGLIGTLIPMGTGLAALSQGDITKLSADLVIAFTTTVVGLAVGIAAFFFFTIKRRWVEEDIKNIELATEILTTVTIEN